MVSRIYHISELMPQAVEALSRPVHALSKAASPDAKPRPRRATLASPAALPPSSRSSAGPRCPSSES